MIARARQRLLKSFKEAIREFWEAAASAHAKTALGEGDQLWIQQLHAAARLASSKIVAHSEKYAAEAGRAMSEGVAADQIDMPPILWQAWVLGLEQSVIEKSFSSAAEQFMQDLRSVQNSSQSSAESLKSSQRQLVQRAARLLVALRSDEVALIVCQSLSL